jgi:hypothetical protein
MSECPWCKEHIDFYLKDDVLSKEDLEAEKERLSRGFWGSIKEVHDEQFLANKTLSVKSALKMRMPLQIDTKNGEVFFGRFWCYSLAEARDDALHKDLKHFWILSGGCSMSWMTPICCEMADCTSDDEALEWEKENFWDLRDLTEKVEKHLEEESRSSSDS